MSLRRYTLLLGLLSVVATQDGGAQRRSELVSEWRHSVAERDLMPVPAAVTVPDSIRVRVGYEHWRGAGYGAAIGGGTGALLGALVALGPGCSDCDPPSVAEGVIGGALLGAAAGGAFGFLAGLATPRYRWVPME
jgi:hypothetical protein